MSETINPEFEEMIRAYVLTRAQHGPRPPYMCVDEAAEAMGILLAEIDELRAELAWRTPGGVIVEAIATFSERGIEIETIEPARLTCSACGSDLVTGPGCNEWRNHSPR